MSTDLREREALYKLLEESNVKTVSIDEKIANHEREINQLRKQKNDVFIEKCRLAANLFTKEEISRLHDESVEVLKFDDFDPAKYSGIFADSSRIKQDDIDFLISRHDEIIQLEQQISDAKDGAKHNQQRNHINFLYGLFAGGNNHDN